MDEIDYVERVYPDLESCLGVAKEIAQLIEAKVPPGLGRQTLDLARTLCERSVEVQLSETGATQRL